MPMPQAAVSGADPTASMEQEHQAAASAQPSMPLQLGSEPQSHAAARTSTRSGVMTAAAVGSVQQAAAQQQPKRGSRATVTQVK